MKLNIVKTVSIAGLLLISQLAQASPVVDTFVVGEPLTAAQMNTIKAIVDVNRSDIESSITAISSLESEPKATVSSIPPAPSDDINLQYIVGSVWVDSTSGEAYILTDSTSGAAVWKLITHAPTVYAIGDTGPAGGIVFYVTAGGLRGLEAAPSDQDDGTGIRWDSENNPDTDTGAIADGIGAGDMNTTLIIAETAGDLATYAAGIAANYEATYSGVLYDDWYLPSKFELNLMWLNLADPLGDGRAVGSDADSVGGFASDGYWSSSQYNSNYAWYQYFGGGNRNGNYNKYSTLRVRAVRAF